MYKLISEQGQYQPYQKSDLAPKTPDHSFKFVLVGDSKSGKSSLASCYINDVPTFSIQEHHKYFDFNGTQKYLDETKKSPSTYALILGYQSQLNFYQSPQRVNKEKQLGLELGFKKEVVQKIPEEEVSEKILSKI